MRGEQTQRDIETVERQTDTDIHKGRHIQTYRGGDGRACKDRRQHIHTKAETQTETHGHTGTETTEEHTSTSWRTHKPLTLNRDADTPPLHTRPETDADRRTDRGLQAASASASSETAPDRSPKRQTEEQGETDGDRDNR